MFDRALFVSLVLICAAATVASKAALNVPLPRMLDLYLMPSTLSLALLAIVAVLIGDIVQTTHWGDRDR